MNKLHRQKQIHLEQWEYDMIIDKVKKKAKKDVYVYLNEYMKGYGIAFLIELIRRKGKTEKQE